MEKNRFTPADINKLTGLTRKNLLEYSSIPPVEHRTVGESAAQWRLYDDEGVRKLCMASMFKALGAPPSKVNEIFGADDYDVTNVLDDLISEAKRKISEAKKIIRVAEAFKCANLQDYPIGMFQVMPLDQWSDMILEHAKHESEYRDQLERVNREKSTIIKYLKAFVMKEEEEDAYAVMDEMVDYLRTVGVCEMGLVLSALHSFPAAFTNMEEELVSHLGKEGRDILSDRIASYQFHKFFDEWETTCDWNVCTGRLKDYSDPSVKKVIESMQAASKKWFNVSELRIILALFNLFQTMAKVYENDSDVDFEWITQAIEYYINIGSDSEA